MPGRPLPANLAAASPPNMKAAQPASSQDRVPTMIPTKPRSSPSRVDTTITVPRTRSIMRGSARGGAGRVRD